MDSPLYEIAIFQMYTLIILGICLLISSGRKISKAVALVGYLFISMVAFGSYTGHVMAQSVDKSSTVLYVGCIIAIVLPILFTTNLGRHLSINIVASFLYDVLRFLARSFSSVLGVFFRRR